VTRREREGCATAGLKSNDDRATLEQVEEALQHVCSDSYDDWVKVGFALYREFGDAGRSLWERWSAKSNNTNKNTPDFMNAKWGSFANVHSIGIGTVFWMAQKNGWRRADAAKTRDARSGSGKNKTQAGEEVEDAKPKATYEMRDKGLYYGDSLLAAPFKVLGRARDPDSQDWAHWLRWHDLDRQEHTYPVSDAKLHGDTAALCGELAQQGLRITTAAAKRGLFVAYLNYEDGEGRVTTMRRIGWCRLPTGMVFVLPEGQTIGGDGNA
jgi:Primase C terminal 2 (PriCT-2)/Domain of unknown function (DUF927)